MSGSQDWSLRLARLDDAQHMPAIERAAATIFNELKGLDELDPEDIAQGGHDA